jgi:hypothetical protein
MRGYAQNSVSREIKAHLYKQEGHTGRVLEGKQFLNVYTKQCTKTYGLILDLRCSTGCKRMPHKSEHVSVLGRKACRQCFEMMSHLPTVSIQLHLCGRHVAGGCAVCCTRKNGEDGSETHALVRPESCGPVSYLGLEY